MGYGRFDHVISCCQAQYNGSSPSCKRIYIFFQHVRRTGWVQKKVGVGGGPESVADHMYRMAVLSFLVDPGAGLDKHRLHHFNII